MNHTRRMRSDRRPGIVGTTVVLLVLALLTLLVPRSAVAQSSLCFQETGFCVEEGEIGRFFQRHGGPHALGYPISRPLLLRGQRLQLMQRVAIANDSDGSAVAVSLLDVLPRSHLDSSVFPPGNASTTLQPTLTPASSRSEIDGYIREHVPEQLGARQPGFLSAYLSATGGTARPSDALPVWGFPLTRAAPDPAHLDVHYQRFERAVFRSNGGSGDGQPLLLGDFVKNLLYGHGLPAELFTGATASPLHRQYLAAAPDGLSRPWELPDSDLAGAFRPFNQSVSRLLMPRGIGPAVGWPAQGDDEVEIDVSGDAYVVGVTSQGSDVASASASVSNLRPLRSFELVLDARLEQPGRSGYSIQLREGRDGDSLVLAIDADRRYLTVYERAGEQSTVLVEWMPVPALRAGTEWNRLGVRLADRRLSISANGDDVLELRDVSHAEGALWLSALTWDAPARVAFRNLAVLEAR